MTCPKCQKIEGKKHSRGCENSKKFERLKLDPLTKDIPLYLRMYKSPKEVLKIITTWK